MVDQYGQSNDSGIDLGGMLGATARWLCIALGVGLVIFGAVYVVEVFFDVKSFLREEQAGVVAHEKIAKLIDADRINIPAGNDQEPVPAGKFLAMLLLFGWYTLWAWIPLSLIYAGGKIVSWVLGDRKEAQSLMRDILFTFRQMNNESSR